MDCFPFQALFPELQRKILLEHSDAATYHAFRLTSWQNWTVGAKNGAPADDILDAIATNGYRHYLHVFGQMFRIPIDIHIPWTALLHRNLETGLALAEMSYSYHPADPMLLLTSLIKREPIDSARFSTVSSITYHYLADEIRLDIGFTPGTVCVHRKDGRVNEKRFTHSFKSALLGLILRPDAAKLVPRMRVFSDYLIGDIKQEKVMRQLFKAALYLGRMELLVGHFSEADLQLHLVHPSDGSTLRLAFTPYVYADRTNRSAEWLRNRGITVRSRENYEVIAPPRHRYGTTAWLLAFVTGNDHEVLFPRKSPLSIDFDHLARTVSMLSYYFYPFIRFLYHNGRTTRRTPRREYYLAFERFLTFLPIVLERTEDRSFCRFRQFDLVLRKIPGATKPEQWLRYDAALGLSRDFGTNALVPPYPPNHKDCMMDESFSCY